jgi:hypothetical protein
MAPLQLEQGAQTYFGRLRRFAFKSLKDLQKFFRELTRLRQSGKSCNPDIDGKAGSAASSSSCPRRAASFRESAGRFSQNSSLRLHDAHRPGQPHCRDHAVCGKSFFRDRIFSLPLFTIASSVTSADIPRNVHVSVSRRSAMTVSAMCAWPHSPKTIFLTLQTVACYARASLRRREQLLVVVQQAVVDGVVAHRSKDSVQDSPAAWK